MRGNSAYRLYDYRHEYRRRELEELSDIFHATCKPRIDNSFGEEYIGIYQATHNYYDVGIIVKTY